MKMKITILGSSCSNPTKNRNLTAVNISFMGNNYLFECPENVQQQYMKAKVSYMKIKAIFISHFHADHFLGLPGLLATMALQERSQQLIIFGPKGAKERLLKLLSASLKPLSFKGKIEDLELGFEIIIKELKEGKIFEEERLSVSAVKLNHDVPCYGFVFKEEDKIGKFNKKKAIELKIPEGPLFRKLQEGETIKVNGKKIKPEQVMDYSKAKKGRKVSIIMDTYPDKNYFNAIKNSDLLIHESSFGKGLEERARETKHSTAEMAAEVAKKNKCKQLLLLHISSRYRNTSEIEKDAKKIFKNSSAGKDLTEINLKY